MPKDAAKEKAQKEKAEQEKAQKEKAQKEKAEKDKIQKEKAQREKAEKERAKKEKAEQEKAQKENAKKEKSIREKASKQTVQVHEPPREDPEAPKYVDQRHEGQDKTQKNVHIMKGILYLGALLIYHFVGFFMTMCSGIGVGILASVIHYNFWYRSLDPFWQTYVTLVFVYFVTELYFRMIYGTRFGIWMDKTQDDYPICLFYIPRGIYFILYMVTVVSLFLQYRSVHQERYSTHNFTIDYVTPKSPVSLELDDDRYFRTIFFVISLAFMMYTLTKESDWVTHRRRVMASGEGDPISKGTLGTILILTGAHLFLTMIYVLPLIGFVFVFKTFVAGWEETYFIIVILAGLIGVFASILERQSLFPRIPMSPPNYAYENHLRIRVSFLHYWLIPLAAGRYFNGTKARAGHLDATDGDFLVFTMEVAIGVLQASKVIANDVYLIWLGPNTGPPSQEVAIQAPEMVNSAFESLDVGEEDDNGDVFYPSSVDDLDGKPSDMAPPPASPRSLGDLSTADDPSVESLMKRIV